VTPAVRQFREDQMSEIDRRRIAAVEVLEAFE
jgi:hypothetical protein